MNEDVNAVCDELFGGDGSHLDEVCCGCAGCAYVLGAAAYIGLMGMFDVLGARERAKPPTPLEGVKFCTATDGRHRCNLDHDDDNHKTIGRTGRVLHAWSGRDRSKA